MSPGGRLRWARTFPIAAAVIASLSACNGKSLPCVSGLSAECAPLYPPTFDNVFTRTLAPTCAQPQGVCHASAGVQGGLLFISEDASYALLLGQTDGRALVIPSNAACSLLVERLESSDPSTGMPPGAPLSAAERCAIRQWIDNGAQR